MNPSVLEMQCQKQPKAFIITLKGKIDSTSYEYFVNYCTPYCNENNIIFDCSQLDYISSAGIGGIFKLMKIAEQNNKKIILCCLKNSVKEIIKLTKLESTFLISNNEEESLRILNKKITL